MSNVLNKTTLQYLRSVNTPDYPTSDWIINPILPQCYQKFWVIEGDTVREMTPAEKTAYLYANEAEIYLIAEKQLLTGKTAADYETDPNAIINPVMPPCDLKYTKVVAGGVVEMTPSEQDKVDLVAARTAKQNLVKQQCTSHILAAYPEPIQRSAGMGIYSSATIEVMQTFIAGCISEENRCFDEGDAATTVAEVDAVTPTFPEA